jgi:hypothetical protein
VHEWVYNINFMAFFVWITGKMADCVVVDSYHDDCSNSREKRKR